MQERRKHIRHLAENLVIEIDGKEYPLVNISTGGVNFTGKGFFEGNPLKMTIRSVQDSADSITAICRVVAVSGESVHTEF